MDRPIRVLVVDDEADVRLLLRVVLSADTRLRVVGEAADGVEAVRFVELEHPDAVVLDLMMPRMNGFEALPLILERSAKASVVVLSAIDAADEAMAAGAGAFLRKERATTSVVETIVDLVQSR